MSMGIKSMDLETLVGNVVVTTSNVGGDVGLALPIIVNDAPFRGLTAGPNVVLTVLGDSSVEIASIDTSQSPLTTKGDIWGYSGIDARIPIGAQDQVLTVDSAQPLGLKWSTPDVATASNLGTGDGVFAQEVANDFQFKSLVDGTEIVITASATELAFTIGAIAISKITNLQTELDTKFDTIVNVGTGAGLIFRDKVGQTANLKTILGGANITVINNADDITISSPPDTQVTASNVGGGAGVFKQKVLSDLEFKSLLANTEILIANNVDDLAFSIGAIAISKITNLQTDLDSKIETITNIGAGVGIANAKVGQNVDLQSLVAGTDISVISNGTEITITNTRVPITPTTASNLGGGEGVFAQKVLEDLEFKSLADTTEILVSSTATEISMLVGAITISKVTGLQTALDTKVDTLVNLGAGEIVGASIVGTTLNLKSLVAGTNMGLVSTANDITISTTAELNTASNVGSGVGVFKQKTLADLEFKSLLANTEILIANNVDDLAFSIGAIAISKVTDLQNQLDTIESDKRDMFAVKRQISVYFSSDTAINSINLGAGVLTELGADTPFLDSDGHYNELSADSGMAGIEDGGFFCIDTVRRDLNFDIEIKFRLTQSATERMWLGFFTADPIAADNPVAEHIALRLSTIASNVNFVISHADGVTQAETQLGLADLLIHTIRIVADEANSKFQYSFDGAALADLTTNIPAATTNLDVYCVIRSLVGGNIEAFDFWYLDGKVDA